MNTFFRSATERVSRLQDALDERKQQFNNIATKLAVFCYQRCPQICLLIRTECFKVQLEFLCKFWINASWLLSMINNTYT